MESKYRIEFLKVPPDPADEFWGMSEIQHIKITEAAIKRGLAIDDYMQAHIKPKPKYLPKFIWEFLLKNLLELRHFK